MASTVWGSVDQDGNILSGSGDFSVENPSSGIYKIIFENTFNGIPAVVATQNNWGKTSEQNTDGVVVPVVNNNYCNIVTGNASGSQQINRAFGFIAIGN
ncbi:hypothetical protein QZM99_14180 [Burkholderia gladioli]|uniref:hypothetical protein n=1 Tax=Burkholderia gladioli TaxID=28095 RepID=UPI00264E2F16|nr:hypothetical protein [Burkholderia gladioli]MDN7919233.1 hypothetical protein [Burkholderia gladioli]